jgi:hypothetical protein
VNDRSSIAALAFLLCAANVARAAMIFSCSKSNDLFGIVSRSDPATQRFEAPADAIEHAQSGSAVLLLAEGYPDHPTDIPSAAFERARAKQLRLYVEFPAGLPPPHDLATAAPWVRADPPRKTEWQRAVVGSGMFGPALPRLHILAPQDCRLLPFSAPDPLLVMARVAGFDTAVYGIPRDAAPLLFERENGRWLIATTKLSGFITARFAPAEDWKIVWRTILKKLDPARQPPALDFEPIVHPALAKGDPLPHDFERSTFNRAADFYHHARLLLDSKMQAKAHALLRARIETADPPASDEEGDGSRGMLEGYAAQIRFDGSQPQRTPIRADCNAEAAMVLSLDALLNFDHVNSRAIAANLLDYVFGPEMNSMGRQNPKHPAFGLIAWGAVSPAWMIANYGDDNARVMLATILASAAQKTGRWDQPLLRALLANLRTTGRKGFRGDRIDIGALEQAGWKHFHDADTINPAPHFESYLWACNLWAYARTGERGFLENTQTAIAITMDAYAKKQWRWMDNIERSRMLLCLAWLVRLNDTPGHRQWLMTVAHDLLEAQQPCGAIQERLGGTGGGHYQIPQSNAAYGTGETPLIQNPGDPASDQLYTSGFALLGLHEAAGATGDASLRSAEDRLAEFLCRIQVRSRKVPYLDGGWFRAFDYRRWDYFASSADVGWGVWSIEAGWGQAWIAATLALRQRQTTLWDMTASSNLKSQLPAIRAQMSQNSGGPWNP